MSPEAVGVLDLCERRGMSLRKACDGAGQRYGTVHNQIKNNRRMPFATVRDFARFFDVPLEYFTDDRAEISLSSDKANSTLHRRVARVYTDIFREERDRLLAEGFAIGTDEVLDWLNRHNGRLEDFDTLRESVDLFYPVEAGDRMFHPVRVGARSLATRSFHIKSEQDFLDKVGRFDHQIIEAVISAHIRASDVTYDVSDCEIDVTLGGERVQKRYRRILAPVRDNKGNRFTLCHSKLI